MLSCISLHKSKTHNVKQKRFLNMIGTSEIHKSLSNRDVALSCFLTDKKIGNEGGGRFFSFKVPSLPFSMFGDI